MSQVFINGEINSDEFRKRVGRNLDEVSVHNIIRSAILDGQLPLPKPVGFTFTHGGTTAKKRLIFTNRHDTMQDDTLTIIKNLAKVIFLPSWYNAELSVPTAVVCNPAEPMSLDKFEPTYTTPGTFIRSGTVQNVLDENIYLFTNMAPVTLKILVQPLKGNTSLMDSVNIMKSMVSDAASTGYIGIPSRSSLEEYVRFIPQGEGIFKYKCVNSMTDEKLNLLWDTYGGEVHW